MKHRVAIVVAMRILGVLWDVADDVTASREYFSFAVWGSLVGTLYHIGFRRQLKLELACTLLSVLSAPLYGSSMLDPGDSFWTRRAVLGGVSLASLGAVYILEAHWRHQFLKAHPKLGALEEWKAEHPELSDQEAAAMQQHMTEGDDKKSK
mmetsp:Transcript_5474/g.18527  ORF Transcript_5474/g.18527 Transcript_5474/m.18527 type:complete len:151 (+) Transcript_5474:87-539(+)